MKKSISRRSRAKAKSAKAKKSNEPSVIDIPCILDIEHDPSVQIRIPQNEVEIFNPLTLFEVEPGFIFRVLELEELVTPAHHHPDGKLKVYYWLEGTGTICFLVNNQWREFAIGKKNPVVVIPGGAWHVVFAPKRLKMLVVKLPGDIEWEKDAKRMAQEGRLAHWRREPDA